MFDQDYFALRLVRLKSSEEWSPQNEGLCFIFPKGGVGQCVNGTATQRLAPGDILVWEGGPGSRLCVPKGAEMVFWSFFLRLEHLLPLFAGNEISLLQGVTDNFKGSKLFPASTALAMKCHRLIEEVPSPARPRTSQSSAARCGRHFERGIQDLASPTGRFGTG